MNADVTHMKQIVSQDTDVLLSLEAASKDLGFDLLDEVIKLGLPPDLLKNPDVFVPSQLFNCLLEHIANDMHCKHLGLLMAHHLQTPHLGIPTRVMSLCQNFREALLKANEYSAFYRDTGPWQSSTEGNNVSIFKIHDLIDGHHYHQRSLFGTAQMYHLILQLNGSEWQPSSVSFSFANPGGRFYETYQNFFDCAVKFDQPFDGVTFDAKYLDSSIVTADRELLKDIELHIETLNSEILTNGDFISHAKQIISQRLNFATCTLEEVAEFLSLTPCDLSKRLEQSALSFITLLEEQVCEKATFYLTQLNAPVELILSALMPGNEPRLNDLLTRRLAALNQW
ncbi:hypothetical protein MAH1_08750 [Sessilibacter sp. MAH1]